MSFRSSSRGSSFGSQDSLPVLRNAMQGGTVAQSTSGMLPYMGYSGEAVDAYGRGMLDHQLQQDRGAGTPVSSLLDAVDAVSLSEEEGGSVHGGSTGLGADGGGFGGGVDSYFGGGGTVAVTSEQLGALLVQVEAMVGAGPHGKLDEYLTVFDLLLSVIGFLSSAVASEQEQQPVEEGLLGFAELLQHAEALLSTARDDLEFEFRDILERRSQQACTKFNAAKLKEIFRANVIEATASSSPSSSSHVSPTRAGSRPGGSSFSGAVPSPGGSPQGGRRGDPGSLAQSRLSYPRSGSACSSSSCGGGGSSGIDLATADGDLRSGSENLQQTAGVSSITGAGTPGISSSSSIPTLDLLPESSMRWLNQTAQRMAQAGMASKCIEAYRLVRGKALQQTVASLEVTTLSASEMEQMPWELLEKEMKAWVQTAYILMGLVLRMEHHCASGIFQGLDARDQRAALRGVLQQGGLLEALAAVCRSGHAFAGLGKPEQLFALLDAYQVLHDTLPQVQCSLEEIMASDSDCRRRRRRRNNGAEGGVDSLGEGDEEGEDSDDSVSEGQQEQNEEGEVGKEDEIDPETAALLDSVLQQATELRSHLAQAVARTFDVFRGILEDVPGATPVGGSNSASAASSPANSNPPSPRGGGEDGKPPRLVPRFGSKAKRSNAKGRTGKDSSASAAASAGATAANDENVVPPPPGGAVDSFTSYVANYIRSYMQRRQVGRNYPDILAWVFADLERAHHNSALGADHCAHARTLSSSSASSTASASASAFANGGGGGGSHRSTSSVSHTSSFSVERETARLVMALRTNLEARAKLYGDEVLQQLFLLNNMHYLNKSMLQWEGWRTKGLFQALTAARRDGSKELMLALADLQDDRLVQHHMSSFQNLALKQITAVFNDASGGPSDSTGFFSRTSSLRALPFNDIAADRASAKAEITRLRKFTAAFDELLRQQTDWVIPDEELRRKVRTKWATLLKEKYRKLLLPHWDDLTTSKYYVHTPESLERTIHDKFFIGAAGPAQDQA